MQTGSLKYRFVVNIKKREIAILSYYIKLVISTEVRQQFAFSMMASS